MGVATKLKQAVGLAKASEPPRSLDEVPAIADATAKLAKLQQQQADAEAEAQRLDQGLRQQMASQASDLAGGQAEELDLPAITTAQRQLADAKLRVELLRLTVAAMAPEVEKLRTSHKAAIVETWTADHNAAVKVLAQKLFEAGQASRAVEKIEDDAQRAGVPLAFGQFPSVNIRDRESRLVHFLHELIGRGIISPTDPMVEATPLKEIRVDRRAG